VALTPAEIIKVKQILKVPNARASELDGVLSVSNLLDPAAEASVRASFIKFDALQTSDSPDRAGMIEADIIKWDVCDRNQHLDTLTRRIQSDIAIAIGFTLDPEEILAF
jgi:hypothetical protein